MIDRCYYFCLWLILLLTGCGNDGNSPDSHVLYLKWLPNGNAQLISHQLVDDVLTELTPTEWDIFDYAVSPDSMDIAVTQLLPNSSKIWQLNNKDAPPTLAVDCPQDFCTNPLWQPNSPRLFYEKRPNDADLYGNDAPEIWWVDLETGVTALVALPNQSGFGMQFSPDGRWFSYASPIEHSLELFDLENEVQETLHVHTVLPAFWHPNSTKLVAVHDLFNGMDEFGTDLFIIDIALQTSVNLSEGLEAADGPAVWSPDGEWLAFGRKIPRLPMGKQIWLVRADGTEAHALTEDTTMHHAFLNWSTDAEWLLYQKSNVQNVGEMPAIYRHNLTTNETIRIAENAIAPRWWHQN
jgi:Tol biopolymer transport system component